MQILKNKKFSDFKNKLESQGINNLYVVSDFDSTLIRPYIDGKFVPSLMGLLRDRNLLPAAWRKKSSEMYNYYVNKAEENSDLPFEERMSMMDEWWSRVYDLLVHYGFRYEYLVNIAHDLRLEYAKGAKEFINWTSEHQVPLIIMSASGLGTDCIEEFIKVRGDFGENIKVISNTLKWDKDGNFTGAEAPFVHSMNKNGELIRKSGVFEKIKNRQLAFLFGDDIGDANMLDGIEADTLKVFMNVKEAEIGPKVKNLFDLVFDLEDSFIDLLQLLNLLDENKR
jgi:HAD superfamily hydrolase (TIGR01544 family)